MKAHDFKVMRERLVMGLFRDDGNRGRGEHRQLVAQKLTASSAIGVRGYASIFEAADVVPDILRAVEIADLDQEVCH